MRLGEVCEATGLTPRQVREWERRGLIKPIRGVGNQRVYGEADLDVLQRVKRFREAGLTLEEIRRILGVLSNSRLGADSEALALVEGLIGQSRDRMSVAQEVTSAVRTRLTRARSAGSTP